MATRYWEIKQPLEILYQERTEVFLDPATNTWKYGNQELSVPRDVISSLSARIRSDGSSPLSWREPDHFGRWSFYSDDVIPSTITVSDKRRTKSPNPDFQKRKFSGEIVIQPSYIREEYEITAVPYFTGGSIRYRDATTITSESNPDLVPTTTVPGIWQRIVKTSATTGYFYQLMLRTQYVEGAGVYLPDLRPEEVLNIMRSLPKKPSELLAVDVMSKLNEGTYDLLTELAELPETLEMGMDLIRLFQNKGQRFRRLVKEIAEESGDPRKLARLGDKIANARLLYRYGILPLSYSFEDIKEVLKEKFRAQYVVSRGQENISGLDQKISTPGYTFNGGISGEEKLFAKRALDPSDSFHQFQKVFGASLPRTAWELAPWSLVVDWFANVGDTLLALSPMPNVGEGSTNSWRYSVFGEYVSDSEPLARVRVKYQLYHRVQRGMHDNVCVTWEPSMNRDRWADAAAFSWQILRKSLSKLK